MLYPVLSLNFYDVTDEAFNQAALKEKHPYFQNFSKPLTHVMNERKKALLTLRVLSTSPQGNLFTKSIPVSGVPVGGNRIEASIIKYSTFMGLICKNI